MRLHWYLLLLSAIIVSFAGYVFLTSEVRTVEVTGKHMEQGQGRRGRTVDIRVIETDQGDLRILKFPVIGYGSGADELYDQLATGSSYEMRVGMWPPEIISQYSKPHILNVY